MKLTKRSAIRKHKRMWRKMAWMCRWHMFPDKVAALLWLGKNPSKVFNQCYCCQYAVEHSEKDEVFCLKCPIKWSGTESSVPFCESAGSPYLDYISTSRHWNSGDRSDISWKLLAGLCNKIANMPVVEDK